MPLPPSLDPAQRQAALEKAAAARRQRAELKEKLKAGSISLNELLAQGDTDDAVAKLKVVTVLESLPGVGKVKARRTMEELEISENRRVRGLGTHQRRALLSHFERQGALGVLLVLSGPSGAGKGTVAASLLDREPRPWLSVSATTRQARPGEVEGRDYVFLDRATFDKWQEQDDFVESFEVFGHLYGTPRQPLVDHLAAGDDVILEIDVQGAMAVRKAFPEAVLVFLRPPSREVQRERLLARAGDALDTIERRLAKADAEEAMAGEFDLVVVNDDLGAAVEQVAAILEARR